MSIFGNEYFYGMNVKHLFDRFGKIYRICLKSTNFFEYFENSA